jgi:hypothetical protein
VAFTATCKCCGRHEYLSEFSVENTPQAQDLRPLDTPQYSQGATGLTGCALLRFGNEENKSSIVTFIPSISAKEHNGSAVLRKGSVFGNETPGGIHA